MTVLQELNDIRVVLGSVKAVLEEVHSHSGIAKYYIYSPIVICEQQCVSTHTKAQTYLCIHCILADIRVMMGALLCQR